MDKRYIVGFTALVAAVALGIALWLSPWDSPGVTAQEVVETACDKTASALEFDLAVSWDVPGNYAHPLDNERDVWEIKAGVSGADYHQTFHAPEMPAFAETIYVDGVAYTREGERQGEGAWAVVDVKDLVHPTNWLGYDPSGEETTRVGGENVPCAVPCAEEPYQGRRRDHRRSQDHALHSDRNHRCPMGSTRRDAQDIQYLRLLD